MLYQKNVIRLNGRIRPLQKCPELFPGILPAKIRIIKVSSSQERGLPRVKSRKQYSGAFAL